MFGTEFEKEGFHYYCYYCTPLPRKKSLSLSRDLQFIVQYSRARPLQPSSQKNWMRNKKSYFCDYKKKELSCIIIELLANTFGKKKSSKFWKWPSWLSYLLKKTGRRVRKLILIFWHSRWHWVLKRSFFSVYPHLPFLLNKSLKVKKWYESSL